MFLCAPIFWVRHDTFCNISRSLSKCNTADPFTSNPHIKDHPTLLIFMTSTSFGFPIYTLNLSSRQSNLSIFHLIIVFCLKSLNFEKSLPPWFLVEVYFIPSNCCLWIPCFETNKKISMSALVQEGGAISCSGPRMNVESKITGNYFSSKKLKGTHQIPLVFCSMKDMRWMMWMAEWQGLLGPNNTAEYFGTCMVVKQQVGPCGGVM